jgi:hypothetical protein
LHLCVFALNFQIIFGINGVAFYPAGAADPAYPVKINSYLTYENLAYLVKALNPANPQACVSARVLLFPDLTLELLSQFFLLFLVLISVGDGLLALQLAGSG